MVEEVQGELKGIKEVGEFKQKIAAPKKLGPESIGWYWHPDRHGVKLAPEWFRERLKAFAEELEVTWNPVIERWQVFMRAPKFQHPICWGWKLLFVHQGINKEYLPLDERLFARLYAASVMKHGSAKEYFARVVREMEREKELREKAQLQDTLDRATEAGWDYSRIKNIGNGSKFSEFHA